MERTLWVLPARCRYEEMTMFERFMAFVAALMKSAFQPPPIEIYYANTSSTADGGSGGHAGMQSGTMFDMLNGDNDLGDPGAGGNLVCDLVEKRATRAKPPAWAMIPTFAKTAMNKVTPMTRAMTDKAKTTLATMVGLTTWRPMTMQANC